MFLTFWLRNVLRKTVACNFSFLISPDGSSPAALASLLFDPPEPQSIGKHSVSRLFYPFAPLHLLSSDSLSSLIFFFLSLLILPTSDLLILSEVPNRESVGFQSLGPGSGDKKMHAPKNRNSPGTLLGPSSGTLLEPCCNLAGTLWNLTSVEPCWNLGGALLKLRWKLAGIAGALQEHGETLLEPCGNPVAGTAGWNIFLWTTACVDIVFLALLNLPGCDAGSLAWTLSEQFCSLAGTYTKTTSASS